MATASDGDGERGDGVGERVGEVGGESDGVALSYSFKILFIIIGIIIWFKYTFREYFSCGLIHFQKIVFVWVLIHFK